MILKGLAISAWWAAGLSLQAAACCLECVSDMGPGVGCYVVVMGRRLSKGNGFPGREGTVCCNPAPLGTHPGGRIPAPGPVSHPSVGMCVLAV